MAKRSTRKEDVAVEADEQAAEATFVREALTALEKWLCMLLCRLRGGHRLLLRVDGDHVFLACPCGYETPGYHSRILTGA